jgi:hypothetical protein
METKQLSREVHLELENMSLKLHIAKKNVQDMEARFVAAAEKALADQGLTKEEWAVDIDRGLLVKKA